jgi:hypothetical protein
MRVTLSDPTRLDDLCRYFNRVQAVARIEGEALVVHLPGLPTDVDARHLPRYLETWLALSAAAGQPVSAEAWDE